MCFFKSLLPIAPFLKELPDFRNAAVTTPGVCACFVAIMRFMLRLSFAFRLGLLIFLLLSGRVRGLVMHMLTIEGRIERRRERLSNMRRGGSHYRNANAARDYHGAAAYDNDDLGWAVPPNMKPNALKKPPPLQQQSQSQPQPMPSYRRSSSVPLDESKPLGLRRRSLPGFEASAEAISGAGRNRRTMSTGDNKSKNTASGSGTGGDVGSTSGFESGRSNLRGSINDGGSTSRESSRPNSFSSYGSGRQDLWARDASLAVRQALPSGQAPSLERYALVAAAARRRASYDALNALAAQKARAAEHTSNENGILRAASEVPLPSAAAIEAALSATSEPDLPLKVEVRAQGASYMIVVRPVTADNSVMYRIRNDTEHHSVFFRQVDCDEYDWRELAPGAETTYAWEEPLRRQKLLVRAKDTSAMIQGIVGGGSSSNSKSRKSGRKNTSSSTGEGAAWRRRVRRLGRKRAWLAASEGSQQVVREIDLKEPTKLGSRGDTLPGGMRQTTRSAGPDGALLTAKVLARGPTKMLVVAGTGAHRAAAAAAAVAAASAAATTSSSSSSSTPQAGARKPQVPTNNAAKMLVASQIDALESEIRTLDELASRDDRQIAKLEKWATAMDIFTTGPNSNLGSGDSGSYGSRPTVKKTTPGSSGGRSGSIRGVRSFFQRGIGDRARGASMAEAPRAPIKTPDVSPSPAARAGGGGREEADDLGTLRSFGTKKSLSTTSVPESEGDHQEASSSFSSSSSSSTPQQQQQQPPRSRRAQIQEALKSVGTSIEQVEEEVWQFAEDRGEDRSRYIRACNQLVVTVLEARGLRGADQSGFSDPCVCYNLFLLSIYFPLHGYILKNFIFLLTCAHNINGG